MGFFTILGSFHTEVQQFKWVEKAFKCKSFIWFGLRLQMQRFHKQTKDQSRPNCGNWLTPDNTTHLEVIFPDQDWKRKRSGKLSHLLKKQTMVSINHASVNVLSIWFNNKTYLVYLLL